MTPKGDAVVECSERNKANGIIDEILRRLAWRVRGHQGMTAEEVNEIHSMIVERRRA